jgi:hypothetical protein
MLKLNFYKTSEVVEEIKVVTYIAGEEIFQQIYFQVTKRTQDQIVNFMVNV